jgi:hypothetical protein
MRRALFALFLAVSCCSAFAQEPLPVVTDQHPKVVPVPGVFPIGCFPGPLPEFNTVEHWERVRDANFTLSCPIHRSSDEDQTLMLDYCESLGLMSVVNAKIIPADATAPLPDDWEMEAARVVEMFGEHPALFGYMLRDEPNAVQFPKLGIVADEFRRLDPTRPSCFNLFPTYATEEQLGTATYEEHVDRFMSTVRPPFLSYDHYPLKTDGTDTTDFYLNLELIRDASLQYDTPAWNIMLSTSWPYFRTPSEGEMRWQAYSSLAYGVKGFFYFTYWSTKEDVTAIVDSTGEPGPLYPVVQQLNGEILGLGKRLLSLESNGVYNTGETIPEGTRRLPEDAPLNIEGSPPLVVGFFESEQGESYVMLANRDHDESVRWAVQFTPDVTGLQRVSKQDGSLIPIPLGPNRRLSRTLPPGGGTLFLMEE